MTLAKLGDFLFEADGVSFNNFDRGSEYSWQSQKRLGLAPSRQFMGKGEETITISGIIYPHKAGAPADITKLRKMAEKGEPYVLSYTHEKQGQYMGKWTIDRIEEKRSSFIKEGAAKKIVFTLELSRYNP